MKKIELNTINFKKFKLISQFSEEANIYSDHKTVYKIFKDDTDVKTKEAKVEALCGIKVEGLILPKEKIMCGDFVGYSMNFIQGKYINRLKLDIKQLINLFKRISALLKKYHNLDIILGDLNYTNILIKSLEEIYFCDVDNCKILSYNIDCLPYLTIEYLQFVGFDFDKLSIDKNLDNLSLYLLFLYILFNKQNFLTIKQHEIEKKLERFGLLNQRETIKTLKKGNIIIPYFEEML